MAQIVLQKAKLIQNEERFVSIYDRINVILDFSYHIHLVVQDHLRPEWEDDLRQEENTKNKIIFSRTKLMFYFI